MNTTTAYAPDNTTEVVWDGTDVQQAGAALIPGEYPATLVNAETEATWDGALVVTDSGFAHFAPTARR